MTVTDVWYRVTPIWQFVTMICNIMLILTLSPKIKNKIEKNKNCWVHCLQFWHTAYKLKPKVIPTSIFYILEWHIITYLDFWEISLDFEYKLYLTSTYVNETILVSMENVIPSLISLCSYISEKGYLDSLRISMAQL